MSTSIFTEEDKYPIDDDGYISIYAEAGINEIAANVFPGENVTRFKEIIDVNPDFDIFGNTAGKKIKLPEKEEILSFAKPILSEASNIISDAKIIAENLDKIPILKGYSKKALETITSASSIIKSEPKFIVDNTDKNNGELAKIIPWLLSGKQ